MGNVVSKIFYRQPEVVNYHGNTDSDKIVDPSKLIKHNIIVLFHSTFNPDLLPGFPFKLKQSCKDDQGTTSTNLAATYTATFATPRKINY